MPHRLLKFTSNALVCGLNLAVAALQEAYHFMLVVCLVKISLLECNPKGPNVIVKIIHDHRRDNGTVQPTAEITSNGHVRSQTNTDGIEQGLIDIVAQLVRRRLQLVLRPNERHTPVPANNRLALTAQEIMARWYLMNTLKNGSG